MLTRYRAHVVVPRDVECEIAVLKGIIGAHVVTIAGRASFYKEQRRLLKRLGSALLAAGPGELERPFADDWAAASTDAARKRVVVDQVASLTDQSALTWHARLVGEIDATTVGIWAGHARVPMTPPAGAARPGVAHRPTPASGSLG